MNRPPSIPDGVPEDKDTLLKRVQSKLGDGPTPTPSTEPYPLPGSRLPGRTGQVESPPQANVPVRSTRFLPSRLSDSSYHRPVFPTY